MDDLQGWGRVARTKIDGGGLRVQRRADRDCPRPEGRGGGKGVSQGPPSRAGATEEL